MSQPDTTGIARRCLLSFFVLAVSLSAAEWRRIGNTSVYNGLASPAGGPVDRVWFSPDGSTLNLKTASGRFFQTSDMESWRSVSPSEPPTPQDVETLTRPASNVALRAASRRAPMVYALNSSDVWRSDDEGASWRNLTRSQATSIVGEGFTDLAVSPLDPQRIVAANHSGAWMSLDGGLTWTGLNERLPNLPVTRLLSAPAGARGLRIAASDGSALEWIPSQKLGWAAVSDASLQLDAALRSGLGPVLGTTITAVAVSGEFVYAGAADGRLWSSGDRGSTWRLQAAPEVGGPVERIWVNSSDGRGSLAAWNAGTLMKTANGGQSWDDLTANLPSGSLFGLVADRETGAVYAATARGVFQTTTDLRGSVAAGSWTAVSGLPAGTVRDVLLDPTGSILYAAVEGEGVLSTPAPHRARRPILLNTADYSQRAAAPGALLSLLGARAASASASGSSAPVLSATDTETQVMVPFEARGDTLEMTFAGEGRRLQLSLPLQNVSPAILVDRDGAGMLMDADTGVQLDALHPARPGMRIQLLATGLGRVTPDWPTGLAAPLDNPPKVAAPIVATLDGRPLEVVRATLAPGYIGFYLVEVELPALLDSGASELALSAGASPSNRVLLFTVSK